MKKIIMWIFVLIVWFISFSFASTPYPDLDTCKSNCSEDWLCTKYWSESWEYYCIENNEWTMWINIDKECMLNGQCSMNIYETLWIRQSNQNPDVTTFAQDIILWATAFFGTVITVIFMVSWLSYIMAWFNWKEPWNAKKWMVWSIVWLLLITLSYTIIRLIQFLATGKWWM